MHRVKNLRIDFMLKYIDLYVVRLYVKRDVKYFMHAKYFTKYVSMNIYFILEDFKFPCLFFCILDSGYVPIKIWKRPP